MAEELRKTGISVVGDVPWGTHFCNFFETKEDLLDTLIPYFKTGLENKEFCVWVVSNSGLLTVEEAKRALGRVVPNLEQHISDQNLEILDGREWYLTEDVFNLGRVMSAWNKKLEQALARGYDGMRVSGDTLWLRENDWRDFCAYEKQLNDSITDRRMTVLCTYPVTKSGAAEVLDVVQTHQFAIARRHAEWEVIQSPEPIQARAEIKRLNEELQRVLDRTTEPPAILRYGLAVLSVIAALTILLLMNASLQAAAHVSLFLCAVIVSTWFGGIRPGFLAILLSIMAFAFILSPSNPFAVEITHLPRLILFALLAFFVAALIAAQRSKAESLRQAHRILDETVQELKRTNVALRREIIERKEAEGAARQSEERFATFMDNLPGYAWMKDLQGRYVYMNEMVSRLPGYESLGKTDAQIWPADLAARYQANDEQVIATKRPLQTLELFPQEGKQRHMAGSKFPIFDQTGAVALVGGVGVDITERIEAEEALRESELRFRQIAENIHEVFWMSTVDFDSILYVSPAYEHVWGRTRGSLYQAPRSFIDAIHPEDRARVVEIIERDRKVGFEVEYRVVRPDGSICWIWDRAFPIPDEAGRVYRLTGIAEDITERKQAEEALSRSEDRLRLVIDTIPTMAWSLRPDGVVDFLNQRWVDYAGLSLEQYVADPMGPIHPDDVPRIMEKWRAQMTIGEGYEDEIRLRRADGEYRWFLVRTEPLRDAQGNLIKWYGSSTDIEDRKQAEEKLKHKEVQLAQAQRLAHIGSWDWDLRTNAVTWSDELYHIFGLQPGTVSVAGEVDRFIHPDDLDLGWDTVKRAIASKEPYDYYHRILRPDGTERIARSRGSIMSDERGEPIKVFGATQDVTELKRAEENLKATSERLRALSASLQSAREQESTRIAREIHDELGGTLTSLRWDLEEVRDVISEASASSQLAALRSKIEVMITLTETILDTVRRLASELRPMALDELGLVEAIEWQALQFETRTGIAVEYECHLEKVDLNSEQSTAVFRILQEALTNILRHAQATEVAITMKQESGEFFLAIKDNGRGITENEKSDAHSLGLLGMRERGHLIGAQIDITGIEGKGTLVVMRIPINESSEHQKKV
jgi:PAS domain S-box-containing protein